MNALLMFIVNMDRDKLMRSPMSCCQSRFSIRICSDGNGKILTTKFKQRFGIKSRRVDINDVTPSKGKLTSLDGAHCLPCTWYGYSYIQKGESLNQSIWPILAWGSQDLHGKKPHFLDLDYNKCNIRKW